MAKISKTTINIIAKELDVALDDVIKKSLSGVTEKLLIFADGPVIKVLLNGLNNKVGSKIPDTVNPVIDKFAADLKSGNFEDVKTALDKFLAAEIKTPFVDGTPDELALYASLTTFLVNLLKIGNRNKSNSKRTDTVK